jgi:hypothetical protein
MGDQSGHPLGEGNERAWKEYCERLPKDWILY